MSRKQSHLPEPKFRPWGIKLPSPLEQSLSPRIKQLGRALLATREEAVGARRELDQVREQLAETEEDLEEQLADAERERDAAQARVAELEADL